VFNHTGEINGTSSIDVHFRGSHDRCVGFCANQTKKDGQNSTRMNLSVFPSLQFLFSLHIHITFTFPMKAITHAHNNGCMDPIFNIW